MANIGKSITIKGDLSGNEDLQIDGTVEGRIDLPNNQLTIGAEGRVKAEVHAKAVVVIGHVTGNLSAADRIQVEATGIVDGDVKAPRLVIQEGAMLNGSVEMGSGASTKTSIAPQPQPQPLAKAAGGP
jgi:cytoskeletal protein CcmA (bactofilin family)